MALFRFTDHVRERYAERILNEKNRNQIKNLDTIMCKDIYNAKEKKEYLDLPRFVLHLWEKHGGTKRTKVYESDTTIFITRSQPDHGFEAVLTCWSKTSDFYFGKRGMFRNSALSNEEIYIRIKLLKSKQK